MIMKIMSICFYVCVIAAIILFPFSVGAQLDWLSYSSTASVRYIDYFDDSLQVISSGGWLKIDPSTLEMRKITNNDGLGTNDLYCVLQDDDRTVWLVGDGRLIREQEGEFKPYLFFDSENELVPLYCITDDGDQLWIGTSGGLTLFSKFIDDGQIEDSYFRFGDFNPQPPVFSVQLQGDTIWIATSDGVAVSDKSNPDLLKSFANWSVFRPSRFGVAALDTVTTLAYFQGDIYLGSPEGVFRLNYSSTDTSMTALDISPVMNVKTMTVEGDLLYVYGDGGYFTYDGSNVEWGGTTGIPDDSFTSGFIYDGVQWIGSSESGLYYQSGNEYIKFEDGGLPGNQVTALASDSGGNVIGGFNRDGLAMFDGNDWSTLDFDYSRDGIMDILCDANNNIWVGTWGDGISMIAEDTTIMFKEDNSSLHGVVDLYTYVVVNGMDMTSHYIFMLNFGGRDNSPVHVVDFNDISRWQSFGTADGLTDIYPNSIACYDDVFVVGSGDKGIFYYYFGPDPFDKADDSIIVLRESNSWLGSDEVRTVAYDQQGTLWVGTRFGLSQYDVGIDRFVNVSLPLGFGPDVWKLAFDRRGNIWMGALNGLARYGAGSGSIDIYTTLNSGLLDNDIDALVINPATNDLWVGTSLGISQLKSTIGTPTGNIEDVIAFPNPFVIREGNEVLSFNYNGNATVRIYTVSGELVRETDINIPWDGRNQGNENVAPGVYLFLLTDEDGSVGRGKILLIRQ